MFGTVFSEEKIAISLQKKIQDKPLIVILLGPPGAGKGTHAIPLSRMLQLPHISTGDLFREHIRNRTDLGNQAKYYMDQGKLVPDELVLSMLFVKISSEDYKRGFILDGFPRTLSQGEALETKLSSTHRLVVLNFKIADSYLVERITGRIMCKDCGASYHTKNNPPPDTHTCSYCSGVLYQRDDDKEEVLLKRLEVYQKQTKPLIEFYSNKKNTLQEISAEKSQHQVFESILKQMEKLFLQDTKTCTI